jgi:hypothetical protein
MREEVVTLNQRNVSASQGIPSPAGSAAQGRPARLGALARSPWAVAGLVFAVYGLYVLALLLTHHDARDFIHIEKYYLNHGHGSTVIQVDPRYAGYTLSGYDGQFYYLMALDPVHAPSYMDAPAYRYTRILYPLTAGALALGMPNLVPYTLILVNLLWVGGSTLALAAWLKRKGVSPWFALAYGLYPGLFIGFQNDLTEPMAYGLVALAIYLFDFGGRYRAIWAGLSFALAALTRETTLVFPLIYGLVVFWGARDSGPWKTHLARYWRQAVLLAGMALGVLLLYKGFLTLWLGQAGFSHQEAGGAILEVGPSSNVALGVFPFQGLYYLWPWTSVVLAEIVSIILPALLCAGVVMWEFTKGARQVVLWALLVNVVVFVILLGPKAYENYAASEPVTTGAVLDAVCCLPALDGATRGSRWWFWGSVLLWETALLLKVTHSLFGFPHAAV